MDERTPLSGACSCGRNHYFIQVPSNSLENLQVLYDDRAEHTLSLRVPLAQIHSTTYAFFPDEAPSTIRRVFTPHHAPRSKRHFCGLCGTSISHWSEETPEEAEWIYMNIGSLRRDSMERLEDAGLLRGLGSEDNEMAQMAAGGSRQVANLGQGREVRGTPWFEEMIQGSELGRIKRRRGRETSSDGRTKVEWEISEFGSGDGDVPVASTSKRKLGSVDHRDDVEMRSG
ncbi:hypothetical protein HO173_006913 [Letharia columbiana]|uniref:CENP-V/GFA domain-containing protein n=1 Tax=Letharia columbiana TaxID=112416 RepID=A0A8H6L4A7_9LECA|nr:uncharacterized protein HO173_006913 [Letharia columbiana]KAF6234983.1 hypothetical protein HO173_006913 [Letharia columbiana]